MGRVLVDDDHAVGGLGDDIGLVKLGPGHAQGIRFGVLRQGLGGGGGGKNGLKPWQGAGGGCGLQGGLIAQAVLGEATRR